MNPTLKVAEEFKDVKFEHATGYKTAANVNTYNARFYEGRYLAGMIAGRMSKTGTLATSLRFRFLKCCRESMRLCWARASNPKAQLRVVWINTWYDPGKERDAANTLIAQGADVVTHHTDSTAVVAAAEEERWRSPTTRTWRSSVPTAVGGGDPPLGRLLHGVHKRSSTAAGRSHRSGAESRTVLFDCRASPTTCHPIWSRR